jgi:hypothetical protein
MNHTAFRALTLDALRRRVAPGAIIVDVWNLLGTNRIVFALADA